MKYLKTFENKKYKFNIGDYVIAIDPKIKSVVVENYVTNNVGQILEIDDIQTQTIFYVVRYDNLNNVIRRAMTNIVAQQSLPIDVGVFPFHEHEIRLATPEEIENQKIKDAISKYNL